MCYPCTSCGRCGKFDPDSPLYTPPPTVPCLKCGGEADPETGRCTTCGEQVILVYTPTEDAESTGTSR